jgi:hypothetical protein
MTRTDADSRNSYPTVRLIQLLKETSPPIRASATILGTIPLRAAKFCEPYTAASGFGWYIFPPFDFDLLWTGHDVQWRNAGETKWNELMILKVEDAFHLAGSNLDELDPSASVPVLARAPEQGIVQVWPGLMGVTSVGWSLLVRPLCNHPKARQYDVLEGIIETDWWHGPLITPIRIASVDRAVEFRKNLPYCQLQLVHQNSYSDTVLSGLDVVDAGTNGFEIGDRTRFFQSLSLRNCDGGLGSYKRSARSRRRSLGCGDAGQKD